MSGFDERTSGPQRIGLALGGGAVRGVAHIGVISVLEREGLQPDFIAGTSAGAIVGAAWAAGASSADMREMMAGLGWGVLAGMGLHGHMSIFDASPLARFIEKAVGHTEFTDLSIPFAAVTCDILTGERVVLREGSVADAALASSALPGLFPPIERGEWLLVDGGLVDNLPVGVACEMGADLVIAVDIVLPVGQSHRPDSLRDMLSATADMAAFSTEPPSLAAADLVIRPSLQGVAAWEFTDLEDIEARGAKAAEENLPRLREIFARQVPRT